MQIHSGLYKIDRIAPAGENRWTARVIFDPSHFIYRAHFPDDPITPGVCQLSLCQEVLQQLTACSLLPLEYESVKFLQIIRPLPEREIFVNIGLKSKGNKDTEVTAVFEIYDSETLCMKASILFQKIQPIALLIPTYNHEKTLLSVVCSAIEANIPVIVINDGSTDQTVQSLEQAKLPIELISYMPNKGKGHALREGFKRALQMGCTTAITIDSDGQHSVKEDLPRFLSLALQQPESLLVGCRNLYAENMPAQNTFANRFSNFWFRVQTGRKLSDTQCGFRAYPLKHLPKKTFTRRYDYELEVLVRMAWKGIPLVCVPINVHYPPKGERISHFRPQLDFLRITILNTCLSLIALLWYYPFKKIMKK